DSCYAGGRVNTRLAEIRVTCFARGDLVSNSLELPFAHRSKVLAFRSRRCLFVEINRYAEFAPQPLAAVASQDNTILHRNTGNRYERNHIRRTHSRMLACMFVQLDQSRSSLRARDRRANNSIGRSDKRDHGAVVIGVRLAIKQHRSRNRFDSGDDLIDDFSTTPFAEIRDALYNATHAENPNRLVFGLQRYTMMRVIY